MSTTEPPTITLLKRFLGEYVPKARESLDRSRHMHAAGAELAFTDEQVVSVLEALITRATYAIGQENRAITVLNHLTTAARDVRDRPTAIHRRLVDALLVDFINTTGMRWGVDYALYARDLKEGRAA